MGVQQARDSQGIGTAKPMGTRAPFHTCSTRILNKQSKMVLAREGRQAPVLPAPEQLHDRHPKGFSSPISVEPRWNTRSTSGISGHRTTVQDTEGLARNAGKEEGATQRGLWELKAHRPNAFGERLIVKLLKWGGNMGGQIGCGGRVRS